jgi:tRNA pseudouridine synthase 10
MTLQLHEDYLSGDEKNAQIAVESLQTLAENAKFQPARSVLVKEGYNYKNLSDDDRCYLCDDMFYNLEEYALAAIRTLNNNEFDSFLVGTNLAGRIINKEDSFKAQFSILGSESFKNHFNREVGKLLALKLNKITDFLNPDITIIFTLDIDNFSIDLLIRSLFIYGRYNKLIRGIPQTHWNCRSCNGRGCELCNYSGKQYPLSVEELTNKEFMIKSHSSSSKFHGAGREDIDVRMLGEGRPFILELKNPTFRSLDLIKIQKKINKKNKKLVHIHDLRFSSKNEVKKIKVDAENTRKIYRAIVRSENGITKSAFQEFQSQLKNIIVKTKISQRTPTRVLHRRADKVRQKKIYRVDGKYLKSKIFEFNIETQGGTYIKELINGDNGRTTPSFTEVFGAPLTCRELDVIQIG